MTVKTFKVYFTGTAIGDDGHKLGRRIAALAQQFGANWPRRNLDGDDYQMRDVHHVGTVWQAMFTRLRADAPNVIDDADLEHELDLEPGDMLVDKCFFSYRTRNDVLSWQNSRSVGGLSKLAHYLSEVIEDVVTLPHYNNEARLQEIMGGELYELQFTYNRPAHLDGQRPRWNQGVLDTMADAHAAIGKFTLRAERNQSMGANARRVVRQLMGAGGVSKLKVRLTDESELIDIVMAPVRDRIRVELFPRYPRAASVFQELEDAYERQRHLIEAG